MGSTLYSSKDFGVITFSTTSQALKAEKVLQQKKAEFVMIPTPREVSASCGLSVKVYLDGIEEICSILRREKVDISGVYHIDRTGEASKVQSLNI